MGFHERLSNAAWCVTLLVKAVARELYERERSDRGSQRLRTGELVENDNRLRQEMIELGQRVKEDLERAAINNITHKTI